MTPAVSHTKQGCGGGRRGGWAHRGGNVARTTPSTIGRLLNGHREYQQFVIQFPYMLALDTQPGCDDVDEGGGTCEPVVYNKYGATTDTLDFFSALRSGDGKSDGDATTYMYNFILNNVKPARFVNIVIRYATSVASQDDRAALLVLLRRYADDKPRRGETIAVSDLRRGVRDAWTERRHQWALIVVLERALL